MKKRMTIFALTTILCGAAAITENHNQAFARSGSHSSGHSANSGRSSHSSGHSASSGRSSHSSGHSASSGRSSHSSGHSVSSGRSSHSSGHSAISGRSSHSSGHSASSGRSSHSSAHSANSGKNSHSKGHNATVGRSTNSKGHSVTTGKGSNFKGHTAVVGRNSNLKTTNAATKGKNVNTKNVANSKNSTTSLVANHNKAYNKKSNEPTNYNNIVNSHLDTLVVGHNKAFTKKSTKPTNSKNIAISHLDAIVAEHDKAFIKKSTKPTSSKNLINSHLDAIVAGHNKAFTKKSTKPTNSKNIAISHLDTIVAEHDKAFITKTSNSKTVATKKNTDKNAKKVNLVNKEKAVDPKLTANNKTVVDTKKYKTKEEISKLSTAQLLKDIIKNRDGKGITQLHGNYCGPGHGDIKNGPPPVDLLDLGCKIHDIGYDQKGYFNRDVNNRFIEFVNKNASKMKPAEREKAYYYAEGFERMNKTPLQEVAKVASIISAPVRMAYNLISDGVKGTVNLISKGVKAIGSLFNSNRIISFGTVPHRNIERAGDRGSGNNPFLLQNQPRRAR